LVSFARAEEDAAQVGVDDVVPLGYAEFVGRFPTRDSGIVYQNINTSELFFGLAYQPFYV